MPFIYNSLYFASSLTRILSSDDMLQPLLPDDDREIGTNTTTVEGVMCHLL